MQDDLPLRHTGTVKVAVTLGVLVFVLFTMSALSSAFSQAHAQDILPEENLLVLACNQVMIIGTQEHVEIVNCRQAAPIQIDGNNAIVHVRVRAETGVFKFAFFYQRTLWSNQGLVPE